jgi:NTE family protein
VDPSTSNCAGAELAIVMSGGGARAAYQVGFLRAVSAACPELKPEILTGVSAGAINAVYIAARPGSFRTVVDDLAELWLGLRAEDVMDTGAIRMGSLAFKWALRLASGGRYQSESVRGFVDTAPLRRTLRTALGGDGPLPGIAQRLERGHLRAVAVTATSYSTGQTVTFCQGRDIVDWERPNRRSRKRSLTLEHVMASAALPVLFPAVRLEEGWFGDGGVRLTNPLAPAIHLGAQRILAISTRHARSAAEADAPAVDGYPPPAQVAGVLLNAVFLDQLDGDALRLQTLNRLLRSAAPEDRRGLRPVELQIWRPSQDLGRLANEYEVRLPRALRYMARGAGSRKTRSNDVLSLIMFQADYLARLVALGEADARSHMHEILPFLERRRVSSSVSSG